MEIGKNWYLESRKRDAAFLKFLLSALSIFVFAAGIFSFMENQPEVILYALIIFCVGISLILSNLAVVEEDIETEEQYGKIETVQK